MSATWIELAAVDAIPEDDVIGIDAEGKSFAEVARELEIPIHFVVEATEIAQENKEENSPFATINS
jgi:predicted RNase H-like HicB family nuclease